MSEAEVSRPLPNESLDSKLSECGGPEDEHIRGDDTVTSPTTKDEKQTVTEQIENSAAVALINDTEMAVHSKGVHTDVEEKMIVRESSLAEESTSKNVEQEACSCSNPSDETKHEEVEQEGSTNVNEEQKIRQEGSSSAKLERTSMTNASTAEKEDNSCDVDISDATVTAAIHAPERTFITDGIDCIEAEKQAIESVQADGIDFDLHDTRQTSHDVMTEKQTCSTAEKPEATTTHQQAVPTSSHCLETETTTRTAEDRHSQGRNMSRVDPTERRHKGPKSLPTLPQLEEYYGQLDNQDANKDVRPVEKLTSTLTNVKNVLTFTRTELTKKESKEDILRNEIQMLNAKLMQSELEKSQQMKETEALRSVLDEHAKEKESLQIDLKSFKDKLSQAETKCTSLQTFLCEAEEVLKRYYKEAMSSTNAIFKEEINKLTNQMAEIKLAQRRDSEKQDAVIQDLMKRIKNLKHANDGRTSAQKPPQQAKGSKTCTII
ncbi:FK506-binding protein 15-like isoform X3 [Corticium candelabrum]|uniref:FK506-binding protein 15-like isoform X3 n=1 Tax=Corticium candelabrum TaxID=121492 RepID=UPI002E276FE9|nr:FK506-binding protein 15-like isoform X3 [Corticium candelabrum]